jgi:biotin transporter BioY
MEVKKLTLIDVIFPKIENKSLALVKDIVLVFSFTLLTAISAKFKIEIGAVPITGQTFAVLLSGALLGSKRGSLSQFFYLLGGLAGIPWFARGGGMAYLMSPTFGYIFGFVFSAYLVGWLCERGFDRKIETVILAMLIGNLIIYLPGLFWLARFVGVEKVLAVGLYPFILGDLAKLFLAGLILPTAWKFVRRS